MNYSFIIANSARSETPVAETEVKQGFLLHNSSILPCTGFKTNTKITTVLKV